MKGMMEFSIKLYQHCHRIPFYLGIWGRTLDQEPSLSLKVAITDLQLLLGLLVVRIASGARFLLHKPVFSSVNKFIFRNVSDRIISNNKFHHSRECSVIVNLAVICGITACAIF